MAYGAAIERNLRRLGFPMDRFFPVNPGRPEVFGRPCYPSVLDVPESVDLAVVATGPGTVARVLAQCAEKGVRAALVLADGFAESGSPEGTALQEEIAKVAREGGIRLVGPNCMGLVVPHMGLGAWAGDVPEGLRTGNVGAVFQSSGSLNLFLLLAAHRRIGLRLAVSAGNQAVLTLGDYLSYAVEEPSVSVVVAFIESVLDPERLLAALDRAADLRKPVIALRVGRSERGQRNAVAHTGNLAGAGVAWDVALRQRGVVLVDDFDELMEAAALFSRWEPSSQGGDGLGLVTISGGDCTLLCDLAEREGVRLPDLSPEVREELVARLEKSTLLGNPLDVENLQRQDEESFYRCLDALVGDPALPLIAARLNLPTALTPGMQKAYAHLAQTAAARGKRLVFLSRASEPVADEWLELFHQLGVPFLMEYRRSLRTIRRLLDYDAFARRPDEREAPSLATREGALLDLVRGSPQRVLGFAATHALLDAYGIPTAPAELTGSAVEAQRAAQRIGFPVAVKASSPELPHKSEAGAIALDLHTPEEVAKAYERVLANALSVVSPEAVEGVVVQEMVRGGTETIVGVTRDRQLGSVLMFGLGGVFVEVMQDVAFRVGRITPAEAGRLIDEVKGAALLRGARGRPRGDEAALADVLVRVSNLAADLGDTLAELDLNPLVVLPAGQGVSAVDALIVRADPAALVPGS